MLAFGKGLLTEPTYYHNFYCSSASYKTFCRYHRLDKAMAGSICVEATVVVVLVEVRGKGWEGWAFEGNAWGPEEKELRGHCGDLLRFRGGERDGGNFCTYLPSFGPINADYCVCSFS